MPSVGIRPCMAARAGATSTKGVAPAARSRATASARRAATSGEGDRPSYGRASQEGRSAVASEPSQASTPAASCSASCGPGATSMTGASRAVASAAATASVPASARARTGRSRARRRRSMGADAARTSRASVRVIERTVAVWVIDGRGSRSSARPGRGWIGQREQASSRSDGAGPACPVYGCRARVSVGIRLSGVGCQRVDARSRSDRRNGSNRVAPIAAAWDRNLVAAIRRLDPVRVSTR